MKRLLAVAATSLVLLAGHALPAEAADTPNRGRCLSVLLSRTSPPVPERQLCTVIPRASVERHLVTLIPRDTP